MKIGILSRSPGSYSTKRLRAAAQDRGHDAEVLDTLRFGIELGSRSPELQYQGQNIDEYDVVIPRIGASITYFGIAVVRQFEQMDVYTPNTASGIANSRDKLRSSQTLSRYDVDIPKTMFVRDRNDVESAIRKVGGAPVIIKLLEGTQGIGVILAPNTNVAEAVVETMQATRQNVLIQQYIAESKGRDIRAIVVGDTVVAAMRRTAQKGEFRSNVHRGGKTQSITLPQEYRDAAVKAAQIMGLRVAGVDMLEGKTGPLILEVNSSPGLEGIEGATGLDVAGAIIDFCATQVDFPEIDIRQRLTVSTQYGVAELHIRPGSNLVGQTLDDGLRERNIKVLTLSRGPKIIPSPRGSRTMEGDDTLLCFGKLDSMRDLVPERRRRKRQTTVRPLRFR